MPGSSSRTPGRAVGGAAVVASMADVGAPMAEPGTSIDTVAVLFGKTGAFPAGPGAHADGVGIAFEMVGAIVDEAGAVFEELSAGAAGVVAPLGACLEALWLLPEQHRSLSSFVAMVPGQSFPTFINSS